ncbi:MAG: CAP domain-containing protein [Patescibacteria group bacterium]|mgnify:CR=1 FL=1
MQAQTTSKTALPVKLTTIFGLLLTLIAWQIISLLFLPKSNTLADDLTVSNIIESINKERGLRNINALSPDARLAFAADYKANDMMSRHYFSHTDPEGNYIWNKIVQAGYTPYVQLGENLAIEFNNTESLIQAWMNSPTHRANVLNEGFKDQGMGLSLGAAGTGQYFSSIANTFGALAIAKKPAAQTAATAQPPAAATIPSQPLPTTNQSPASAVPEAEEPQASSPATSRNLPAPLEQTKEPLEGLRTSQTNEPAKQVSQNFILPGESASTNPQLSPINTLASEAVIPPVSNKPNLNSYTINRYLMLGLAFVLIIMAASDLKKMLSEKLKPYDKITNNLVLLVISLIVIAFMYWL